MLPREIRETLPESIDPDQITAVLSLKTGLGSSWGETCVLLHGTRMLALSRDSVLDPFQVLELDAETPPRLDIHSWEEKLHLTAIDGKEYGLLFSELDKKEALEGLGTMYEALEAWPAWVAVLEFQLELATITERRVELMVQLGQLHLVRLDQPNKAAELFQKVLEQAPLNTEATEGLESLLGETPQPGPQAEALLGAYRAQGQMEKWAALQIILLDASTDDAQRFRGWVQLADLFEGDLSTPERAMAFLLKAWLLRPDESVLFSRILALAEHLGLWEPWIEATQLLLERDDLSNQLKASWLWHLGQTFHHVLADHSQAIAAYEQLRTLTPGRMDVLDALEELYALQEDWVALLTILEAKLQYTAAPDAQVALLVQIATLHETQLDEIPSAIDSLKQVLDLNSGHTEALAGLERLYTQVGQWKEMASILKLRVDLQDDAEVRFPLMLRLADLHETRLEDRSEAIAWLQRALLDDMQTEPLSRLILLLQQEERWPELLDAQEQLLERTEDPKERIDQLTATAHIHARLDDVSGQEKALRQILTVDPGHLPSLAWLQRLLEGSQRIDALVVVLNDRAHALDPDAPERLPLIVQRAQLLERELQRHDDAILAWDTVLAVSPDHVEALNAQIRLHRLAGNLSQMASVMEHKIALLPQEGPQKKLLMDLGVLYEEELHDPEQAARHYSAVLDLEPRHPAAFQRLEALDKAEQDWPGLIELYLRRAGASKGDVLEYTLAAAKVAETRRSEPERAYQLLMKLLPNHWHASTLNAELARLAAATDQWRPYLDACVKLTTTHHDPADRRAIEAMIDDAIKTFERRVPNWNDGAAAMELADLFELHLDNPRRALAYYRQNLKANPNNTLGMEGVRRLLRRKERWSDLVQHLEAMVELQRSDREALQSLYTEILEIHTTHAPSPSQAEQAREALERLQSSSMAGVLVGIALAVVIIVVAVVLVLSR